MSTNPTLDRRRKAGLCPACGGKPDKGFSTCSKCRTWSSNYQRVRNTKLRKEIFAEYGGAVCICCGEDNFGFLTLDHINGGGCEHRREVGGGENLYRWLREQHYPSGFQVLCYNCNCGRAHNGGICPHKKAK